MDGHEVKEALAGAELVPFAHGSLPYIKEILQKCLDAGIPATAGHPPGEGGKG